MRMVVMVLGLALGSVPMVVLADGASRGGQRVTRCCLELDLPGLPPGPVCAQVRGLHHLRPRLACRLLGGRPIGRGDCSPAACQGPAA